MRKILLSFFLICFLFLCVTSVSGVDWWNTDWNNCVAITIDSDFVDDNLVNIPVLISIDDSIGAICKTEGEDIRFTLDNITLLNHEIEKWIADSDREIWVNVTSVASDSDTIIYMYFNNSGAEDGQNIEGTWNSNYMMIQHLDGANLGTTIDSTSNNNDGSSEFGDADYLSGGRIGYGLYFDGNDWISLGGDSSLKPTVVTMELWLKFPDLATGGYTTGMPYDDVGFDVPRYGYNAHVTGTEHLYNMINEDGTERQLDSGEIHSINTWYYQVNTYDGDYLRLYADGELKATSPQYTGVITYSGSPEFGLGVRSVHSVGSYFKGYLDEIRISDIVRTVSWIKFSYHSGTQTGGFLTWGSIQSKPTIGDIPNILYVYPVNNTDDLCPCFQIFGVNVSDNDGHKINIIFSTNVTGSWIPFLSFSDIYNGSYYSTVYDFNVFDSSYWWIVNVTDTNGFNNSGILVFDTTDNINCGIGETTDEVIGYAIIFGLIGGILGGITLQHKKRG